MLSTVVKIFILSVVAAIAVAGCSAGSGGGNAPAASGDNTPVNAEIFFWTEKFSAGTATSADLSATSHAYSYPVPNLTGDELKLHIKGDALFAQHFTEDSLRPEYGLGPVFNNSSCIGCHNRDGRGSLPSGLSDTSWIKMGNTEALLLKISVENEITESHAANLQNHFGEPAAVPGYSQQLFNSGAYGLRGETSSDGQAEIWVKLQKSTFQYPDGEQVTLSKPIFDLRNPYDLFLDAADGQQKSRLWQSDVKVSPRMGMPMYGLGLLESIPEKDILQQAEIDRSSEGVHGTPNLVYDVIKAKNGDLLPVSLGRFGVKGSAPSVQQQAMGALNGDVGVTNPLFPIESIFGTKLFDTYMAQHPTPMKIEVGDDEMNAITFYSQTLAVPARRDVENLDVIQGAKLFSQTSCTSCHTPSWKTDNTALISAYRNQKIYPYTDLLLHDMGEGLSDGRKDFKASGQQWKTRALWGLGLTKVVNPRAGFLHDGRALTLEEAILWHDGEAKYAKDKFAHLAKSDRDLVIRFLQSL